MSKRPTNNRGFCIRGKPREEKGIWIGRRFSPPEAFQMYPVLTIPIMGLTSKFIKRRGINRTDFE
jgi:hypothetical protein